MSVPVRACDPTVRPNPSLLTAVRVVRFEAVYNSMPGEEDLLLKRSKRTSKEPIRFRRDIGSLGEDAAEDKPSSVQQPRLAKKKKATQKRKRDGSDSSEESEEDSLPLSKKSKRINS